MKKVLILGVTGMLGHNVYKYLKYKKRCVVKGVTRKNNDFVKKYSFLKETDLILNVDLKKDFSKIDKIISDFDPDVIINCVVAKDSNNLLLLERLNIELPRYLDKFGKYCVHISSDIILNRNLISNYKESKILLEKSVNLKNNLVIRTSFFGHSLKLNGNFIEDFINNFEKMSYEGYVNYYFNGIYVKLLVETIFNLIANETKGVISVGTSKKISKFELLSQIKSIYNINKNLIKKELGNEINNFFVPDIIITLSYKEQIKMMYKDYTNDFFNNVISCRHCSYEHLKPVIDMKMMPLAGNFLKKKELSRDKLYPLELVYCENCNVVQTRQSFDPKELFLDYRYLSSVSLTLRKHFEWYASLIKKEFPLRKKVLEIGCNDGVLLNPLKKEGFDVLGIDPAKNVVEIAQKKDFNVIADFFNKKTSRLIKEKYGTMDIIIANNVFAHIEPIREVFESVYNLLDDAGILIFEVQYLKRLIKDLQYDFFYHEHIFYYSINAIINILKIHNLELLDLIETDLHGGSMIFFVKKKTNNSIQPNTVKIKKYLNAEKGYHNYEDLKNFENKICEHKKEVLKFMKDFKNKKPNSIICAFGASGRSVTFTNFCNLNKNYINFFIDESPERNCRHIPGTHIPIYDIDILDIVKPDLIIITAWTYYNEIKEKLSIRKLNTKFVRSFPRVKLENGK